MISISRETMPDTLHPGAAVDPSFAAVPATDFLTLHPSHLTPRPVMADSTPNDDLNALDTEALKGRLSELRRYL